MAQSPELYASNQPNSALDQLNAGLGIVFDYAGFAIDKYSSFISARDARAIAEAQAKTAQAQAAKPNAVTQWTAGVTGGDNAALYAGMAAIGITMIGVGIYLMKRK